MVSSVQLPLSLRISPNAPDERRFQHLFRDNVQFVGRCLLRFGVHRDDVEDVAQQVFMIIHQKIDVIEVGKERAFAGGVAARVASHYRRSESRPVRKTAQLFAEQTEGESRTPEEELIQSRARIALEQILEEMSEPLRQVFVLYELEQLGTAEIAEFLAVPRGTIASRLRLAREHFLRRTHQQKGDEHD